MLKPYFSCLLMSLLLVLASNFSFAQSGHNITINIEGYTNDTLMLGYRMADKTYLQDTTLKSPKGYVFAGTEPLKPGVYIALLRPSNENFEFFVNPGDQTFELSTKGPDYVANMKVKQDKDNELFYAYMRYLAEERKGADAIRRDITAAGEDKEKKEELEEKLKAIDKRVKEYQSNLIAKEPKSFTVLMIKGTQDPEIPTNPNPADSAFAYRYYRAHYFDGVDFSDERFVRTPILHNKLETYFEKLVPKVPDSLCIAVDEVLAKAKANKEVFRFTAATLLNKYATSKIIGMDAVYVYMVDKYYAKGDADWVSPEQLKKIIENANTLRPLLIGKKAPEFIVQLYDYEKSQYGPVYRRLSEMKSEYTVIFFWKPGCSHCKTAGEKLKKFYEANLNTGIEVLSITNANADKPDEVEKAIKEIKEQNVPWINAIDPTYQARKYYDVRSTPMIYLLDRDKTIISKRLDGDQLQDFIQHHRKNRS